MSLERLGEVLLGFTHVNYRWNIKECPVYHDETPFPALRF